MKCQTTISWFRDIGRGWGVKQQSRSGHGHVDTYITNIPEENACVDYRKNYTGRIWKPFLAHPPPVNMPHQRQADRDTDPQLPRGVRLCAVLYRAMENHVLC